MNTLSWRSEQDENYNTTWAAAGPYGEDGESSDYDFKIKTILYNDKVWYQECSDAELMMDEEEPGMWVCIHDAKEALESYNEDILAAAKII